MVLLQMVSGNVVGGGDLSLGADGTLDLKYNANGITNTFVSGATGSFFL